MRVDLLDTPNGWFVLYFVRYGLMEREVDRAGPFNEEWEAEDCRGRA